VHRWWDDALAAELELRALASRCRHDPQGFALPLPFFSANRGENERLNQNAGEASTLAPQFR
jgi:hypothetical protein